MKIAILGTRGIPNNYGGFEQFAEFLSVGLVKKGHDVTVYNPHFHIYPEKTFDGVAIRYIYSPEEWMGASANFVYDFLCLKDALRLNFDVILDILKKIKHKDLTNEDMMIHLFYTEMLEGLTIQFQDIDSVQNGLYIDKDTVLTDLNEKIYLDIALEEK